MTDTHKRDCSWHEGDEPIDGDSPYCPECDHLLQTEVCPSCGKEFLDWSASGFDDVVAAPRVSSSADMCCAACIGKIERAIRESDEEHAEFFDGYDPYDGGPVE